MTTTLAVCGKCGRTEEWHKAKAAGWLIASLPDTDGHMLIRCPDHVTGHALRTAGLPQQRISKRIRDNIDRGLWSNYGSGYMAAIGENDPEDGGGYYISYHKSAMPAFNVETVGTLEALILKMREVEPDLRKWHLTESG